MKKNKLLCLTCLTFATFSTFSLTSCETIPLNKPLPALLINNSHDIEVGESFQLNVSVSGFEGGLQWSSSDENVASVDSLGYVKGVNEGEATIRALVHFKDENGDDRVAQDSVNIRVLSNEANVYKATFVNYDGTVLWETSVEENVALDYQGEIPYRVSSDLYNYSFKGWDKDPSLGIKEDTTFVAEYYESDIDFGSWSFYLTTKGEYYVGYSGSEKDVVLPTSYNYRPVVGITGQGFYGNTNIESVTLGDKCTYIGLGAFYGCTNLKEINFGDSLELIDQQAFDRCTSLVEVNLPDTCMAIGPGAFEYCSALESINWPKNLLQIQSQAFFNCTSLTIDPFPEGLTLIGESAFSGDKLISGEMVIPDSVTYLGDSVFSNTSLTSGNIPATVANEFDVCPYYAITTLESIMVDEDSQLYASKDGVLYDKEMTTLLQVPPMFKGNNGIFNVPDTVTTIGDFSCVLLTELSEIDLPKSVKELQDYAFYVSDIEHVKFEEGSSDVTFGWYTFANTTLKEFAFPEGVTTINKYMFYDCNELSSVTLVDSIQQILDFAFYGSQISELEMPEYIQTLSYYSFAKSKIKEINIPKSVNYIDSSVFSDCTELTKVNFEPGIKVTEWSGALFDGCTKLSEVTGEIPVPSVEDDGYIQLPFSTFRESALTTFTVPEGFEQLGNWCFDGSALKEIYLPQTMMVLGKGCFRGIENLNIHFAGTKEEWSKVIIELESGNDEAKKTRTVVCSDGVYSE